MAEAWVCDAHSHRTIAAQPVQPAAASLRFMGIRGGDGVSSACEAFFNAVEAGHARVSPVLERRLAAIGAVDFAN